MIGGKCVLIMVCVVFVVSFKYMHFSQSELLI